MEDVRIAMWSGPRNISTAMMRCFGARPDTIVVDEPFYAIFLLATGIDHPLREQSIASQAHDWREVVNELFAPLPEGKKIFFQKHMTHHMVPEIGLDWMADCRNAFLIRDPRFVISSYIKKRESVTLDDIGLVRQWELFEREAHRLGKVPPVIDSMTLLENPSHWLAKLCAALDILYTDTMLTWPAGPRETDGVWASHWYHQVEQSTGFSAPTGPVPELPGPYQALVEAAMPYYQRMHRYHL